jgi:hypothetical protein
MRRLLALAATAAVLALPVPAAQASYECLPDNESNNAVCVQLAECTDLCFIAPGVQFKCYLGFRGETVCRVVRALSFEVGGTR